MGTAYISTGSTLKSGTLAAAFVEAVRLLNDAEITRNAANPAVAPKNNITMDAQFDGRVFNIAASLPLSVSIDTAGKPVIDITDYLGSTYTAFTVGTGTAKSTDLPSVVLELGQMLSAAEKSIQPETDQPNNIQVDISLETLTATITAAIPFTPTIGTTGQVTLTALDYV